MKESSSQNWILRFIKGMFIGSGFILPGVSGGALAAIFGMYERIIRILANITKDFKNNFLFFLPVGLGGLLGIVILSFGVSFLLGNFETIILWFFVGCIVGTAPSLWKEAGKEGRSEKDLGIFFLSFIVGFIVLFIGNQQFNGAVAPSFFSWFIAGSLIALGVLVPGLSPSNFIVYMGLYTAMADGFKSLDLSVLIPIAIGGLVTIIVLSKLIEAIFKRYYSYFFHFIVGIVIASTIMIIPTNYADFSIVQYLVCALMLVLGTALGKWMSKLEDTYK